MSRVYLETAQAQLAEQRERRNSLRQRAHYFAFSTALLTVLLALSVTARPLRPGIVYLFLALAVLAYLVLLLATYESLRIEQWSERPNPDDLESMARQLDEKRLALWIAREYQLSVKLNEPRLREKAEAHEWALGAAVALSLALTLAVVSLLLWGGAG